MGDKRTELCLNSSIGTVRGPDGKTIHDSEGLVPNVGLATKRSCDETESTKIVLERDASVV